MKKIVSIVMVMVFVLSLGTVAFAEQTEPKDADVTLIITSLVNVDAFNVGQTIALEANALKKGSACSAMWSVSRMNSDGSTFSVSEINYDITGDHIASVVKDSDLVDNWVAIGSFTGKVAGTYQITATLTMTAGKSDVSWTGSDSTNVTIINPVTLKGVVAKNFVATEVWNNKHTNITGYNIAYDLYNVYSDDTQELRSSLTDAMGAGQKVDNLTIVIDNVTYSYIVINPLK